jgi:phosphonate transport system substrate-binding protein
MELEQHLGRTRAMLVACGLIQFLCGTGCDRDPPRELDLSDVVAETELRCSRAPPAGVWRFSSDPRSSPQEDARQFLPFLKYLSRATRLEFELQLTPPHRLADEGRPEYRAVIVTAPSSPIRSVTDLRGRSFAFGDINMAQGHLIPRIVLAEHGIEVSDLSRYEFVGSHHECARAVAAGRVDAGGMQELMGTALAEQGLLRIVHTSRPFASSCIVASGSVPEPVRAAVTRALLDFQPTGSDAPGLYRWDRSVMAGGFAAARDEDYAELREWSRRFGLVPEDGR